MYHPPLIEPGTDLVTLVETERFRIRPMTVHDAIRDYEAVASSPAAATSVSPLSEQKGMK